MFSQELDRLEKEAKINLSLVNDLVKQTKYNGLKKQLVYLKEQYESELKEISFMRSATCDDLLKIKEISLYVDIIKSITNYKQYGIYLRDNLKYLDYLKIKYILCELYNIEL